MRARIYPGDASQQFHVKDEVSCSRGHGDGADPLQPAQLLVDALAGAPQHLAQFLLADLQIQDSTGRSQGAMGIGQIQEQLSASIELAGKGEAINITLKLAGSITEVLKQLM